MYVQLAVGKVDFYLIYNLLSAWDTFIFHSCISTLSSFVGKTILINRSRFGLNNIYIFKKVQHCKVFEP
jgi:hypothetical protein